MLGDAEITQRWVALYLGCSALPPGVAQEEFQSETHPPRATVARAPGGITLGREQGEPRSNFTDLGSMYIWDLCAVLVFADYW